MKIEDFDEAFLERFWSRVDKSAGPDACWVWLAGKCKNGYGQIWHKKKVLSAHRIAFILSGGVYTPDQPFTLHSCHNPACVSFLHLRAWSQKDNVRDCVKAGRMNRAKGGNHGSRTHPERVARGDANGARTHPERLARGDNHYSRTQPERLARGDNHPARTHPERVARGERSGNAKLTEEDVRSIRALVGYTQAQIAKKFGVAHSGIGRILKRKIWRHVV